MAKKSTNRRANARYVTELRHRINVGRAAVEAQVGFFNRQFGQVPSEWKADDTRVTFADFAISEQVASALRRDFPKDDFCSEEGGPIDEEKVLSSDFTWVLDPIDGTNNYALGFPVCAISLALLYKGYPVYGFIYDHASSCLIEGGDGFGLMQNRKKINRDDLVAEAQVMLGLHFPMPETALFALTPLLKEYRVRCLGSGALTLAHVATGYLSGAIDLRVKIWDIAAGYALCLASGVEMRFIEANPFPLKTFSPQMAYTPYYCGSPVLIELIEGCFKTQNTGYKKALE